MTPVFFLTVVSGADRDRLGYLLAGIYALVALVRHFAGGRRLRLLAGGSHDL